MKKPFEPLTDEELKNVNGGDGIIAFDPVTGAPFPEENGGYPEPESEATYPTPGQA